MRPNPFSRRRFAIAIALCALFAAAASAATITGTVTNGTTKTPAAGDTVTLIALDQSMREITHTTTDAQGHFSIDAPDPGMHLIRIDHQGAGYFQPAPPNTPNVNAQVFDVAATVAGVSTVANVMRVETDQQGLRVTQSFFIKNDSSPPRTQFGKRSYDFFLPPNAVIEGSAAMAPGGMPVQSSPVPLGEKGHYAFLFPLRPGVTQFQLSYHLPYSGSLAFDQHFASPTDSFVVMMPKSMSFKAGEGVSFQQLNETPGALTYLARNGTPSHPFAFTVSGSGAMPRDTQAESQGSDNAGLAVRAAMQQQMIPVPGAALACLSTRPIPWTSTSGGSWGASRWCSPWARDFCCAVRAMLLLQRLLPLFRVCRISQAVDCWRRSRMNSSPWRQTVFKDGLPTQSTSSTNRRWNWFFAGLWQKNLPDNVGFPSEIGC